MLLYEPKKSDQRPDFFLVRHIDSRWNHIEASLLLMYEKLCELGFTYSDGEIVIIEPDEEQSDVRFH